MAVEISGTVAVCRGQMRTRRVLALREEVLEDQRL
uniref:Uncharacterized protein n=1 Tax=Arundo donax TaxID=35708 RepID=A0A0A9AIU5_ARUDO